MSAPPTCPVCHGPVFAEAVSKARIHEESDLRESFVNRRLGHRPEPLEAMDLTRFAHGGPARLLTCPTCGLLLRDEQDPAQYEDDLYDSALMKHLYPRYLRAFEEKKSAFQPLLRAGAEVIEVGSHLGAFLQTAEEWGWRPIGLDIGESTSSFAKQQGLTVRRKAIEDYAPHLRRPEAVFIWNCFEQLEDPSAALQRSHKLLDRHGLLVVRVPNAAFYLRQHRSKRALQLLGYNNLLGFPYLHGYTPGALHRLLRLNHFEPVASLDSSLITPPYPEMTPAIRDEWRQARQAGENQKRENQSPTAGPWLEVVSRKVAERPRQ